MSPDDVGETLRGLEEAVLLSSQSCPGRDIAGAPECNEVLQQAHCAPLLLDTYANLSGWNFSSQSWSEMLLIDHQVSV